MKKSVICIGSFNGLHLGHIAVIQAAVEYASKYSFKVILIRIKKEGNLNLQNKIIDKSLLKRHGVNKVIEYDFLDIKNILGRDFLDKVIYENNVQGIFVGEDFKYGKNGDGNISTLHNTCQFYNIYSQVIPLVVYNEQKISTTIILNLLLNNNFTAVKNMFADPYYLIVKNFKIISDYKINGTFLCSFFEYKNSFIDLKNILELEVTITNNILQLDALKKSFLQNKNITIYISNIA